MNILKKLIYFIIIILVILGCIWFVKHFFQPKPKISDSQNTSSEEKVASAETETPKLETKEKISSYKVPILMYHYIRDVDKSEGELGANLSVSPAKFDTQMKWLSDNAYKTVGFQYLLEPYKIANKPIIITFDDGYRDAYTNAFPILKKYNFTGVFYIIIDSVGKPEYLTWEMIKEMKNAGMQFGSHTLTHPDLRNISASDLDFQLRKSKEKLDKELGQSTTDFCYPAGKYNEDAITALKNIGYKTAVLTSAGVASEESNLLKLPRQRMQNETSISKAAGE